MSNIMKTENVHGSKCIRTWHLKNSILLKLKCKAMLRNWGLLYFENFSNSNNFV